MAVARSVSWRDLLSIRGWGKTVYVEDVPVDEELFSYLAEWLDSVERRYSDDVVKNVVAILAKSLREISVHKEEDFIPYGDFKILDGIAKQLMGESRDPYFKPNPYMVVLYGPPGTGKTTWARQVAKKYLFEDGVLKGLYLEVTVGDLTSKWVGVPIQTAKSVLEAVKTDKYMSVLLMDEADAVLIKPERADSGFAVEQAQLIAEMKSQLSFVMNQHYPTLLILTTNYKDAIVRSDAALADRVVAWLEVPPPPMEVREQIIVKALSSVMRQTLGIGTPLGDLTAYRAFLYGSAGFRVTDRAKELKLNLKRFIPSLPYAADFLIGMLSAWGWNPLDPSLKLAYTYWDALLVWRPENPLFKVYARPIMTLMEMYRVFSEEAGVPRSFLRVFTSLKRGFEDAVKFTVKVYAEAEELYEKLKEAKNRGNYEAMERVVEELKSMGYVASKTLNDTLSNLTIKFEEKLPRENLGLHPIDPTVLFLDLAKYSMSREFARVVDDILSLASPIVYGIRHIYMPQIIMLPYNGNGNALKAMSTLLARVTHYNKVVDEELRNGRLLEPLRIMYTEPNLDIAWRRALESINKVQLEDYRALLKLPLLSLKLLHPAIHAKTVEEKAKILYVLAKDTSRLEKMIEETVHELELEDLQLAVKTSDTIDYYKKVMYPDLSPEFFLVTTAYPMATDYHEFFGYSPYVPRETVEEYVPAMDRVSFRMLEMVSSKNSSKVTY